MRLTRQGFLCSSIHAVPRVAYVAGFTGRQRFIRMGLRRRWHEPVGVCAGVFGHKYGTVFVWHAPLVIGEYDIVIDANHDGFYNTSTDGLDSGSPGFVVIDMPSVPVPAIAPSGIVVLIGLLCVIGMSRLRGRFN